MPKTKPDRGPAGDMTLTQVRNALKRANQIANESANEHGMCSAWEDIMDSIRDETGLDFKPRRGDGTYTANVRIEFVAPADKFDNMDRLEVMGEAIDRMIDRVVRDGMRELSFVAPGSILNVYVDRQELSGQ
jgi:hypothetical protein